MLFTEALEQLKEGAQLYRTGWTPIDGYIVLMPGMKHVWKIVLQPQPNAGNYIFSFEDLNATDWEKFVAEAPISDIEPENKCEAA